MKQPEIIEQPTTERNYKNIRNILLAIIVFLIATVTYVETHREEHEPKKAYHIWEGKGWIDSLNTFTEDPHCKSTPNKD